MNMCRLRVWIAAAAVVSALVLGCGGEGASKGPKTYPVTGTITQGGKPVEGATVMFLMADGKKSASGLTDRDGRYSLSTAKPGDGALPGQYKVSVVKYEVATASPATSDKEYVPPKEGETAPAAKSLLPSKYENPQTSGLTAEVKASGENKFDFTLE